MSLQAWAVLGMALVVAFFLLSELRARHRAKTCLRTNELALETAGITSLGEVTSKYEMDAATYAYTGETVLQHSWQCQAILVEEPDLKEGSTACIVIMRIGVPKNADLLYIGPSTSVSEKTWHGYAPFSTAAYRRQIQRVLCALPGLEEQPLAGGSYILMAPSGLPQRVLVALEALVVSMTFDDEERYEIAFLPGELHIMRDGAFLNYDHPILQMAAFANELEAILCSEN